MVAMQNSTIADNDQGAAANQQTSQQTWEHYVNELKQQVAVLTLEKNAALAAAHERAATNLESDRAVAKLLQDKLKPYTGRDRRPHVVQNFLTQFKTYAKFTKLNTAGQVAAMGALLADDALTWYQTLTNVENFEAFEFLFKHRWGDPLEEENARRQLQRLTQGRRPVKQYTEEFKRLSLLIPNFSDTDKFFQYKQGLTDQLQRDLRLLRVTTYEEAVRAAEDLDSIDRQTYHRDTEQIGRFNRRRNDFRGHERQEPIPMEIGAIGTRGDRPTMANFKDFKTFPHLTPELREFLRDRNACLYCRELEASHSATNCPTKRQRSKNA